MNTFKVGDIVEVVGSNTRYDGAEGTVVAGLAYLRVSMGWLNDTVTDWFYEVSIPGADIRCFLPSELKLKRPKVDDKEWAKQKVKDLLTTVPELELL